MGCVLCPGSWRDACIVPPLAGPVPPRQRQIAGPETVSGVMFPRGSCCNANDRVCTGLRPPIISLQTYSPLLDFPVVRWQKKFKINYVSQFGEFYLEKYDLLRCFFTIANPSGWWSIGWMFSICWSHMWVGRGWHSDAPIKSLLGCNHGSRGEPRGLHLFPSCLGVTWREWCNTWMMIVATSTTSIDVSIDPPLIIPPRARCYPSSIVPPYVISLIGTTLQAYKQ